MKRLAVALCLCAPALFAQQEPTPFWLPPALPSKAPPAKKKTAPPPVKSRKRVEPGQVREPARPRREDPPHESEPRQTRSLAIPPEPEPRPERRPVTPVTPEPEPPAETSPRARAQPPRPAAPEAPTAIVADLPVPEPVPAEPVGPAPRFSAALDLGLWGKSPIDGGGRWYDFAYGIRLGYELLPERLELELLALRAGRTAGSAFANASTTHDLFTLRAFYLLNAGRFTLLAGGGAGVALAQTHYTVQDVGGTPVGLDATSGKLVLQVTAGGRARVYRGLDLRLEVSALLRDGKVDVLPLAAAGWAF